MRGARAIALAVPASLAAGWCVAGSFALAGPMCFVRAFGLWTRATDEAWLTRFSELGLAHGALVGALLAWVTRSRAAPTLDRDERALAWALAPSARPSRSSVARWKSRRSLRVRAWLIALACALASALLAARALR